jgi:hypothetical protein
MSKYEEKSRMNGVVQISSPPRAATQIFVVSSPPNCRLQMIEKIIEIFTHP